MDTDPVTGALTRDQIAAVVAVVAARPPPATLAMIGRDERIERFLSDAGYDLLPGDAGVALAADLALLPRGEVVGDVAADQRVGVGRLLIAPAAPSVTNALRARGFRRLRIGDLDGPYLAWVQGDDPTTVLARSGSASAPEANELAELERRITVEIGRLSLKTTQTLNAVESLSRSLTVKGAAVAALRGAGLLPQAAALLGHARKAKAMLRRGSVRPAGAFMSVAGTGIHGPVVIAAVGPVAASVHAKASGAGAEILSLRPGNGHEGADPPALIKPSRDSLAGWLALADDEDRRRIRTFLIDPAANADDVSLLRGRLQADQAILVAGQGSPPPEMGPPRAAEGSLALYGPAPPGWLESGGSRPGAPDGASSAAVAWPKISMIMVSFNQAAFLEQGILSILDQGYPNLEFIVVDGASKDGSIDILERYRDRFDHLVIEPDRGQSDGLNKGFDRATGDILSWLNSDDLLLPDALFRVADAFTRHGVDVVAGGCRQVKEDGTEVVLSHHNHLPFGRACPLPLEELLDFDNRWLGGCFFFQPEVFFSRDIWRRSGGGLRLDLYYVLDYDLWLRMAAAGARAVHIPDFLAASRIHEQQKTTFGETPFVPEARRLLAEYADGVRWSRPG